MFETTLFQNCLGLIGAGDGTHPPPAGPQFSYWQIIANLKSCLAACHRHASPVALGTNLRPVAKSNKKTQLTLGSFYLVRDTERSSNFYRGEKLSM